VRCRGRTTQSLRFPTARLPAPHGGVKVATARENKGDRHSGALNGPKARVREMGRITHLADSPRILRLTPACGAVNERGRDEPSPDPCGRVARGAGQGAAGQAHRFGGLGLAVDGGDEPMAPANGPGRPPSGPIREGPNVRPEPLALVAFGSRPLGRLPLGADAREVGSGSHKRRLAEQRLGLLEQNPGLYEIA
jgi:hypothetical protein